jgi:hypothetical protein
MLLLLPESLIQRQRSLAWPSAQLHPGAIHDNSGQPRRHLRSTVELLQVLVRGQKSILNRIFRVCGIAKVSICSSIERRPAARENVLQFPRSLFANTGADARLASDVCLCPLHVSLASQLRQLHPAFHQQLPCSWRKHSFVARKVQCCHGESSQELRSALHEGDQNMKAYMSASIRAISLAVLLLIPAWGQQANLHTARPGTVNYVEGQASIGTEPLGPNATGSIDLVKDQSLTTQAGKVEILLTPGVFVRVADNSSVTMRSPELVNTIIRLDKGRALAEVLDIHPENNIRIELGGASTKLLNKGLYDFDADHGAIRVFKGKVEVYAND